jgi:hypothetical protein
MANKISVYSLADLKNTTDDALANYLNSISFTQSHSLTDVRLALGYAAVAIAGALFYADWKLGWDVTRPYTLPAVVAYALLNGAFTYWMFVVEKGVVYVGERKGTKVLPFDRSFSGPDLTHAAHHHDHDGQADARLPRQGAGHLPGGADPDGRPRGALRALVRRRRLLRRAAVPALSGGGHRASRGRGPEERHAAGGARAAGCRWQGADHVGQHRRPVGRAGAHPAAKRGQGAAEGLRAGCEETEMWRESAVSYAFGTVWLCDGKCTGEKKPACNNAISRHHEHVRERAP